MKIHSNIVPDTKVREIQQQTLDIISQALVKSFGPKGSTTAIVKDLDPKGVNISVQHTKDGHTIVSNILFMNPIERSVQELLTNLTQYVVKEVGDGTTSAIVLCKTVFDSLCEHPTISSNPPADTIYKFASIIDIITKKIIDLGWECTLDDIYKIALISTNNNEEIAGTIKAIYEEFGMGVYIDVGISNEVNNIVKKYDGMTLDTGFADRCMINDNTQNKASIRDPKIYCFNDAIDTPEMLGWLDAILENNIFRCYRQGNVYEPVPTVILCKQISPDTSSYFESMIKLMNAVPDVPLLIVSDIHQYYIYEDIAKMCGAPWIKKYLNPELQQKDAEAGLAPTPETILEFCGRAELVESDQLKTKIINPEKMFTEKEIEDGKKERVYSEDYNSMLHYLETQVDKAIAENAGVDEIQKTKRRLNNFKGNMVDFLIGGLTLADRSNLKASVEDAVFNCFSAANNGVGYGANFMAFSVLHGMIKEAEDANKKPDIFVEILYNAYEKLISILYNVENNKEVRKQVIDGMLKNGCPLNIRTNEYDKEVRSSIKSDVVILETINKILMLMFTSNQYLIQTPMHNIYLADE